MAVQGPNLALTLKAGESFTDKENRFVWMSADMTGKYSTGFPTVQAVGVSNNQPAGTTEELSVVVVGIAKVELGGTLTAGARVSAEAATGKAIAAISTHLPQGILLTGGSSGDLASVLLTPSTVIA